MHGSLGIGTKIAEDIAPYLHVVHACGIESGSARYNYIPSKLSHLTIWYYIHVIHDILSRMVLSCWRLRTSLELTIFSTARAANTCAGTHECTKLANQVYTSGVCAFQ